MKTLLVCKDINYGASKTDSAANTAKSPDELADGAVGIFGFCGDGKSRLISTSSVTETAYLAGIDFFASVDATYGGTKFLIARGTTKGAILSPMYDRLTSSIVTKGKENELPMYQMSFVGYDPITAVGSLNMPTAVAGDSITVAGQTRLIGYPDAKLFSYSYGLTAGMSNYDALLGLAAKINIGTTDQLLVADIVGAAGTAGVAMAAGTAITVTKGSPTITGTGMTVLTAGQYLKIANNQPIVPPSTNINTPLNTAGAALTPSAANTIIYKIVSASATTITLDRPYTGETKTGLGFASFLTESVLSTNLGLRLIALPNAFPQYPIITNVAVDINVVENLENATVTRERGAQTGSGTTNQILNLEKEFNAANGWLYGGDNILNTLKPAPSFVDLTCNTYDIYYTVATRSVLETSDIVSVPAKTPSEILVAFPTSASTLGEAQFNYDTLIRLLSTTTGDVSLSA